MKRIPKTFPQIKYHKVYRISQTKAICICSQRGLIVINLPYYKNSKQLRKAFEGTSCALCRCKNLKRVTTIFTTKR